MCSIIIISRYTVRGRGVKHSQALLSIRQCLRGKFPWTLGSPNVSRHIPRTSRIVSSKIHWFRLSKRCLRGTVNYRACCVFVNAFLQKVAKLGSERGPRTGWLYSLASLTAIHFPIAQNPRFKLPVDRSRVHTFRHSSQKSNIFRTNEGRTSVFLHYRMERERRAIKYSSILSLYYLSRLSGWLI